MISAGYTLSKYGKLIKSSKIDLGNSPSRFEPGSQFLGALGPATAPGYPTPLNIESIQYNPTWFNNHE